MLGFVLTNKAQQIRFQIDFKKEVLKRQSEEAEKSGKKKKV